MHGDLFVAHPFLVFRQRGGYAFLMIMLVKIQPNSLEKSCPVKEFDGRH